MVVYLKQTILYKPTLKIQQVIFHRNFCKLYYSFLKSEQKVSINDDNTPSRLRNPVFISFKNTVFPTFFTPTATSVTI